VRVASVGIATAKALGSLGITSSFTPSTATGKALAAELPFEGHHPSVLYPCSALAADTVAESLADRGFNVTRLETYTTVPAQWAPEEEAMARSAAVVSFGSPSAARVWHERVGATAVAACIGETSAEQVRWQALCRLCCWGSGRHTSSTLLPFSDSALHEWERPPLPPALGRPQRSSAMTRAMPGAPNGRPLAPRGPVDTASACH
jgi:hypothetical protein